jgi:hypothetical protein
VRRHACTTISSTYSSKPPFVPLRLFISLNQYGPTLNPNTSRCCATWSRYDAYQVGAEIGSHDPAVVNAYGANLTATLKAAVLAKPQNGAFLDGCLHHGGGWPSMQAKAEDGSWASPIDAFTIWYGALDGVAAGGGEEGTGTGRGGGAQRYWQTPSSGMLPNGRAASDFPCQACCPCKPNRTSGNFAAGCKKG